MNLFDLAAKLTLDSSEYEKGLKNAEKQGSGFGEKLKSAMKVGAAAVTAVTTSAIAMGGALVKATGDVAAHGDEIDKLSQKLGLSKTSYQEWDYILGQSGVEITNMSTGLKTLTNKLDDAKNGGEGAQEMFAKLGLSMEDLNNMSREDVFAATIQGFQGMADSTERAALANDLFGKSGQELTPLFNASIEETEALRQAAHDLGFVMSDESVSAAADYQDALDTLQRSFGGVKQRMMGDFMPAITSVMGGLSALLSGDDSGVGKISEGIESFIGKIADAAPKLLQIGSSLILSLGDAILQNLPTLISTAGEVIMSLSQGLISQLPMILKVGLQVLLELANGIASSLPTLIPTVVSVILEMVKILTDPANIANLIDAAIAIIFGLADGLIEALPLLLEAAPEILMQLVTALISESPKLLEASVMLVVKLVEGIISNLPKLLQSGKDMVVTLVTGLWSLAQNMYAKAGELIGKFIAGVREKFPEILAKGRELVGKIISGLKEAPEKIKNAGMDIVRGLWNGISSGYQWITTQIRSWVGNVVSFFKKLLKISSPSKVFAEIGKWTALGFGEGFADEMPMVEDMMSDAMPDPAGLVGPLDFRVSGGARGRTDSELLSLLRDIRDNMDTDLVLSDGTLIGWMDKALGRRATQRARGNA